MSPLGAQARPLQTSVHLLGMLMAFINMPLINAHGQHKVGACFFHYFLELTAWCAGVLCMREAAYTWRGKH